MDDAIVAKVKKSIVSLAIRRNWSLDQLQFAEDYIDALAADKATARRPIELTAAHARDIKEAFSSLVRPSRR